MGVDVVNILVGDIGGTKADLAIFSTEVGLSDPIAEESFPSRRYPDLESILREFLQNSKVKVDAASFGVAGPVIKGRASITNLPWVIDEEELAEAFELNSVHLINDLVATTYFIPSLKEQDVYSLGKGVETMYGAIAVVAPGTGLGEAFAVWDGKCYRPYASEGGHCDFAPNSEVEMELLHDLRKSWDHISWERVCSGPGIWNIYKHYHKDPAFAGELNELDREMAKMDDPTPYIVDSALKRKPPCSVCLASLNTFIEILGAEAGNLALKVLATGGVYLAGGITPRILPALKNGPFMRAFRRKGRMASLLSDIPVSVVLNHRTALLGAAQFGLDAVKETGEET